MQINAMRIANSILGVTLLSLLAAALVSGQVRAKQEHPRMVAFNDGQMPANGLVLARDDFRGLGSIPELSQKLAELPVSIQINVDGVLIRSEIAGALRQLADQ